MGKVTRFFTESIWGKSFLILLAWNLVIRLLAIFGYFLLPERFAPLDFISRFWQSNFLFWSFANFDGEHYLSIARFGYQFRGGFPQYAFFPFLPVLIKIIFFFVRDYYLAGMLASQLGLYLALVYISKWCRELKLPDIRWFLLVSTGTIFLASVYTEPVFLALAAMSMYFAEKRWWGRAILFTALATATRANGLFLPLFILVKLLQAKKSVLISTCSFLLSYSGLFSYMVFLYFKTGDAFNWFHSQGAWGKATATSPITTFLSYLRSTTYQFQPDFIHLVVVIEVLTTLVAIFLFIILLQRQKLGLAYWLYLGGNLTMPILTGSLGSMPRFFLILFPLLTVVPTLSKWGKTLYYTFSVTVCIIGIMLFTRGYWYG